MQKHATRTRHNHREYDFYADLDKIKQAFAETARGVRGRAGDAITSSLDDMKEKTETIQENVQNYVYEKPIKSLAIALTAGFLLGKLLHK
jgi:ElaB/YqjD/DUF883 family membrane-anchored ribosome-binding protein